MNYNPFNRFQRLFAPDPEGLSARLAAFTATPAEPAAPVVVASTQPVEPVPPVVPPVEPAAPAAGDPPAEEEEDEFQFPEVGKPVVTGDPKVTEFDEAAFEAETTKAAEGMEAKAFDKFKALRAELKVFKKQEFKPDPNSIPEFTALKAEVEELRKKAEENDGLRTRLDSVMKSSDELAVKESEEFISKVTTPIADMKAAAKALAESAGLSPEDLLAIIADKDSLKQDKALSALEANVSRRTLSRIERLCDDYRVIEQDEARLLADIPKTLASARAQEAQRAEQDRKALTGQFQAATRASFTQYAASVPGFVDATGALTPAGLAAQSDTLAIDPHALTPDELGFLVFASKGLAAARKEVVRLTKENRALGGKATIPGKTTAPAKVVEPVAPEGQTLKERMKGQNFTFNPSFVG